MTSLIVSYCSKILEGFFDCYWTIYKTQIPSDGQCLDDSPEFRAKLTFFGKMLHKIRPLMVRKRKPKQKKLTVQKPPKPPKNVARKTSSVNPRIYYSLVANTLHTIIPGYISHISNDTSNILTSNYYDKSYILSHFNDLDIINKWLTDDCIKYLLTDNTCVFPNFNDIDFPIGIRRTFLIQNAGGNSEVSEALSMQFMFLSFNARKFIPEMEVKYTGESKICDYIMKINDDKIGVSVTRAISHPINSSITLQFAIALLQKKLIGIIVAKKATMTTHKFRNSIVHIWCKCQQDVEIIKNAYRIIIDNDPYNLYVGIYVICSICISEFIYTNDQNV